MLSGILIALFGTAYSAYVDIKTGYVNDFVTHSMIILGAVLVAFTYPLEQALWIYAIAGAVFGILFLMYAFGQMGGGDVKLLTALALLVPYYPKESMKEVAAYFGITPATGPYPFILSIFVLFSIIYMVFISFKYIGKIYAVRAKIKDFRKKCYTGLIYSLMFVPLLIVWFQMSKAITLIFVPIAAALFITPFKNDTVRLFFAQKKQISKLDDDDVLALEMIDDKIRNKLGLWRKTFTTPELVKIKERARKAGIKTIIVCENYPRAVIYIFAALVINLIFGDLLFWLILNGL